MRYLHKFTSFALTLGLGAGLGAATGFAADLPVLRASVLQIGTLNWELATIKNHGLDEANGFTLDVQGMADNGATRVAFAGDEADIIVADWIWVARQRADGKDYVAIPYSTAVGGVVVPEGSDAQTLEDLKGGKIGIAGGPLDKSWLILRAYSQQEYGFDIADESEQVFGAPPLIFKTGIDGETDGAINFWHFLAKMQAAGMRELISVADASTALGLDPDTPLLTYVLKGEFVAEHPELASGLYKASRAAKDLLMNDPAIWEEIRPMMNANNDAQFEALKAGFIAGIPSDGPVDTEAADKTLKIMAELGGAELVGKATSLPDGLFADVMN